MTGGTDREAHRAGLSGGPAEPAGTPHSAGAGPEQPGRTVDDAHGPGDALAEDGGTGGAGDGLDRPGAALEGQGGILDRGGQAREGDGEGTDDSAPRAKHPDRGYLIAATVVKPLMRAWFRIRLEGSEHIPGGGPVILASNHRSNMDPVLLASAVERPLAFMAKAELFVGPLGWILRWIGQFPVRRGGIDREALRRTDAVLARGSMLGLFPEGTRGDGGFAAVHPGLAYIVVRQRCPVLPVAIFGTERVRRRFGWLPFASPVRIVIGPPIDLPRSTSDRAGRRAASEVLRQRLQAFLASVGGAPPS
jgi:1-acyl-sn-glycerol-3-phosphate acyltransferase